MVRHLVIGAVLAAGVTAFAPGVGADTMQLTTEEAMVDSPQAGLKIYVRNKHPADMSAFTPERTLLFVHGATYPAETAFDLELGGDVVDGHHRPPRLRRLSHGPSRIRRFDTTGRDGWTRRGWTADRDHRRRRARLWGRGRLGACPPASE